MEEQVSWPDAPPPLLPSPMEAHGKLSMQEIDFPPCEGGNELQELPRFPHTPDPGGAPQRERGVAAASGSRKSSGVVGQQHSRRSTRTSDVPDPGARFEDRVECWLSKLDRKMDAIVAGLESKVNRELSVRLRKVRSSLAATSAVARPSSEVEDDNDMDEDDVAQEDGAKAAKQSTAKIKTRGPRRIPNNRGMHCSALSLMSKKRESADSDTSQKEEGGGGAGSVRGSTVGQVLEPLEHGGPGHRASLPDLRNQSVGSVRGSISISTPLRHQDLRFSQVMPSRRSVGTKGFGSGEDPKPASDNSDGSRRESGVSSVGTLVGRVDTGLTGRSKTPGEQQALFGQQKSRSTDWGGRGSSIVAWCDGVVKEDSGVVIRARTNATEVSTTSMREYDNPEFRKNLYARMNSMRSVQDIEQQKESSTKLTTIVLHQHFDGCIMLVVLANALLIGARTQLHALNGVNHPGKGFLDVTEHLCTTIFVVELGLRLWVLGRSFFTDPQERNWNVFDAFLVLQSLVDILLTMLFGEHDSSPVLKVLRVLRVARIMRVLRTVRFVPELRVMVQMIISSILSLSWVLIILIALIYVFSIVLTTGVTEYLEELERDSGGRNQRYGEVKNNFGSLFETMYTLYMAMAGGIDWGEVSVLLREAGWVYEAILISYTFFAIFAVINVVTGMFVDGAIEFAKRDRTILMQKNSRQRTAHEGHLLNLLKEIDQDGEGRICWEAFQLALQRKEIKQYIAALQVEFDDARELFDLLDADGSGEIDIVEFVTGMNKLRGEAKRVDIHLMLTENRRMLQMVSHLVDLMDTAIDGVSRVGTYGAGMTRQFSDQSRGRRGHEDKPARTEDTRALS